MEMEIRRRPDTFPPCVPHVGAGLSFVSRDRTVAAGQVISRLKLSWYGRPGTVGQQAVAFKIIFIAVVVYFAIYLSMYFALVLMVPANPQITPPSDTFYAIAFIWKIFHYVYWIVTTIVLTNLRRFVRQKYAIPAYEAEDCCCSCWCPCLVSAQMLRHTTDYDVYPAYCCTETGLPPHAPAIV